MKHTRILFLIALVAGLGLTPGRELTSAAQSCQQEGGCFVFESKGYITDPSTGQTTIAFRVTNKCRNPVSYVAVGTGGFTRVAPGDGSVYNGDLGLYDVAWTRAGGTPGFESVKFTPALKNFANSASDRFSVVVSNFNPAIAVMVRAKAGNAQETYSFLLSQTCGMPTPTRRIYWGNIGTYAIGRANLDGQNVNQSFISGTRSTTPFGMAVDSRHIYWASNQNHTVGRADLDGQNVNQSFIANVPYAYWVAVDSRYIYWTDAVTNTIGRADLNGQNVNQNFISTASSPFGLAVDNSHIYWTAGGGETIGRADLDGQNVNQSFITGPHGLYGVAVDSSHIYWADLGSNTIGRADLDGQNVNLSFISGCSWPRGVTVDSSHIYWANDGNSIGQADLDGQNVNQNFIPNLPGPFGIAVDPE